jgi:hypothetical protein
VLIVVAKETCVYQTFLNVEQVSVPCSKASSQGSVDSVPLQSACAASSVNSEGCTLGKWPEKSDELLMETSSSARLVLRNKVAMNDDGLPFLKKQSALSNTNCLQNSRRQGNVPSTTGVGKATVFNADRCYGIYCSQSFFTKLHS